MSFSATLHSDGNKWVAAENKPDLLTRQKIQDVSEAVHFIPLSDPGSYRTS